MTELTPKEAVDAIHSGRWPSGAFVAGRVDLRGFKGETLPPGVACYELDATGAHLQELPADLRIENRLVLDNCLHLLSLPKNLTTGSISLRGCVALNALPEGINTWFLDMTGCSRFEQWPQAGAIHNGSLILRNCTGVRSLPGWIGRLSQLNLAGCVQLAEIPNGISVSSWVDIGGTGIRSLPPSLAGAALRWRGVRVDARLAFRPQELTAAEALAEKNTEIRRVMIERMGYLKFANEAKAKVLDTDRDSGGQRQLLSIDLKEDEPLVGLACNCPSTGRQYFLRVPPQVKTCHQAAAWMAGYDDPAKYRPIIET